MRDLERQFEVTASQLREEYLENLAHAQNGAAEEDDD
jgi:hypothetical protein